MKGQMLMPTMQMLLGPAVPDNVLNPPDSLVHGRLRYVPEECAGPLYPCSHLPSDKLI